MTTMGGSRGGRAAVGVLLFCAAIAAACGESPSEIDIEGTCIAVANVDGVMMTTANGVLAADSVGAQYLSVTRRTGCLDQGQPSQPLAPGESNFLEVGTALHRVPGFGATERLAYQIFTGEWLTLTALQN
jgi:hypothetical protein